MTGLIQREDDLVNGQEESGKDASTIAGWQCECGLQREYLSVH